MEPEAKWRGVVMRSKMQRSSEVTPFFLSFCPSTHLTIERVDHVHRLALRISVTFRGVDRQG